MADIAEQMFETVEVIAKKLIDEVRFDQTVKAIIVNDANASRGEYLVSTGNATFIAYCADDKYKKDDAVLVTIPEGDYKNQKIIIGKQVDDTNSAIHKTSPFQSIQDVSGNLISKFTYDNETLVTTDSIEMNMYANGKINDPDYDYFSWDYGISDFIASDVYNRTLGKLEIVDNVARIDRISCPGLLWDSGKINYYGFTRLGIQAQFKTWLGEYNIIHGHYGLMLQVQFEIVEELEDNEYEVKRLYQYLNFGNDDFFGDTYNFETYYTQEKVFDIKDYQDYTITRLRLFCYEREDFVTMDNEPIEYMPGGFSTGGPNIFVKDPYICLGFDADSFTGDSALICSANGLTYTKDIHSTIQDDEYVSKVEGLIDVVTNLLNAINEYNEGQESQNQLDLTNVKTIGNLYEWINNENIQFPNALENYITAFNNTSLDGFDIEVRNLYLENTEEDGQQYFETLSKDKIDPDPYGTRDKNNRKIVELRWIHKDEEKETIKLMANGELPQYYYIYWYRYKLGAKSPDQFAGAHWVRFYGPYKKNSLDDDFKSLLDPDSNDKNLDSGMSRFQAKMKELLSDYTNAIKNGTDYSAIETKIRTADSATNNTYVEFYPNPNYQEEKLKVIIIKQDASSNRLSKVAESNVLVFSNQNEVRSDATLIDENALSIKYSDDEKGVYLIYDRSGHIGKEEQGEVRTLTAVFDEDETDVYKKPDLNNYTSVKWIFPESNTMIIPMVNEATTADTNIFNNTITTYYTIKKNLDRNAINNTVRLEVMKDGLEYTAQVQMIFGTAGTSGSDYTIFIEWQNNQNAIIKRQNNNSITYVPLNGIIHLMDQSGSLVDNQLANDLDVQLDWYQLSPTNGNNDKSIAKESNLNFKYPINNGNLLTSANNITDFNNNYYIATPYNGTNFYFDMSTGNFNTGLLQDQQVYGVVQITNQENPEVNYKDKIIFKPVDEAYNSNIGSLTKDNNDKIIYAWNSNKRLFIKYKDVYIIDPWDSFQETETYYYPANSTEYVYNNSSFLEITTPNENNKRNFIIGVKQGQDPINSLHILRVTFNNFGDYQLVALFPIPIKYEMQLNNIGNNTTVQTLFKVDYINGPTDVRYSTGGEVDFNKNAYEICCRKYNNATGFDVVKHNNESIVLPGYWKLLYYIDSESSSNIENILPSLAEYIDDGEGHKQLYTDYRLIKQNDQYENVDVSFNVPWLQPLGVYYKDAPLYGVQFKTNEDINITFNGADYRINAGTILWTQPILCYQDNYPSTTLNKWNGQDIQIDEDNGTIVANGMAAGKKESDNTFTGVVIGDWSRTDVDSFISKNTGVYGFNHGAMSYAFKDDGTAFLGKDGHGRIYFNGNKATIYSAGWVANKNQKTGLLMDVDDGKIHIQGRHDNIFQETEDTIAQSGKTYYYQNGQVITGLQEGTSLENGFHGVPVYERIIGGSEIILSQQGNPYFKIAAGGNTLIHISDSQYYLASSNYNGTSAGVKFDLKSGLLEGYSFKIKAIKNSFNRQTYTWSNGGWTYSTITNGIVENSTISIDSNAQTYPLEIGSSFKVDWNGNIRSDGLYTHDLQAWNANISTITATNITASSGSLSDLNVTGYLHVTSGNIYGGYQTFNGTQAGFKLNSNGQLEASQAKIYGEINATSGTFSGGINAQYFNIANNGSTLGTCGFLIGNNGTIDTSNLGFSATGNGVSVVLESNKNIRLSADGNIYLEAGGSGTNSTAGITIHGDDGTDSANCIGFKGTVVFPSGMSIDGSGITMPNAWPGKVSGNTVTLAEYISYTVNPPT